ncbi:MAG: hypothetical protein M3Z24_05195, partial [Chloroflexota bacterium]|nr:hypothetical protein [Chloroflexota bacterium]
MRANSEICSRCGQSVTPVTQTKSKTPSHRPVPHSIPPASPHRAGHYSGLHPEDQPYQSSMVEAQHPTLTGEIQAIEHSPVQHEPVRLLLPTAVETLSRPPLQVQSQKLPGYNNVPTIANIAPETPLPPVYPPLQQAKKPFALWRGHFVRLVLALLCIFLLLAGSILAYVFIHKSSVYNPQLSVRPNQLRATDTLVLSGNGFGANDPVTFAVDTNGTAGSQILDGSGKRPLQAHADDIGLFSVKLLIPANWSPGQHTLHANDEAQGIGASTSITILPPSSAAPLLQLSDTHVDLGADAPGAVSNKSITLINSGGEEVHWLASSDQSWLSLTSNSGVFAGRAIAVVSVNRGNLAPSSYLGHILFRQEGSSNKPLSLTVTMSVKPVANSLTLSSGSLTYSGTPIQNPADQPITLQNSQSFPLDWKSGAITGDGAPWLSITPASGHLEGHTSETISVHVQSVLLAVGSYQGTIAIKGGSNPQISVALNVVAANTLTVSPPSLNFSAVGQNPGSQTLTLQNGNGGPVDWTIHAATVDGAHWLSVTPASGHLESNALSTAAVSININGLQPRAYQGTFTITYGAFTSQIAASLTVSTPPSAAIGLSTTALNFTTLKGTNPGAQSFTMTNSGNATLNWALAEDNNGSTFAPVSARSGSLAPGKNILLTVTPSVMQANGGVLMTNVTISDTDAGTSVHSQRLAVGITIKDQAIIT